jgi:eukaryotic-like serine/threonine-protein kinase
MERSRTAQAHRRVGPYRVLHSLKNGGMAELFLAVRDGPTLFEREVVLKCVRSTYAGDEEFSAMFADEARIGALLSHPGIAKVLAYGSDDGRQYLAIEYVRGEDLQFVIDRARESGNPFPIPLALGLCTQIAEALHHAHSATDVDGYPLAIVHRDISPANVIVTVDAHTKLLDFGIAKAAQRATHTSSGFVKGKIDYMSPEHLAGERVDATADVFSLGCMLYEMLTLHLPFERGTEADFLQALATGQWTPLTERRPDASAGLEGVLRRALWPTRDRRYQSAREMQIALEQEFRKLPYSPLPDRWTQYRQALRPKSEARGVPLPYLGTEARVTELTNSAIRIETVRVRLPTGASPAPRAPDRPPSPSPRFSRHRLALIGLAAISLTAFAALICVRLSPPW